MLQDIETEARYTRELIGREAFAPRVMQAMAEVPREKFVPPNMQGAAFENGPLPIGHGQTISQPYIVALMTDLLEPAADHRILEIGTGCGYQTAILSRLCARVYTVEVVRELGAAAAARLQLLGYRNIEFLVGNGYAGWPDHAPYDGIIVTAAASHVPPALVEQLEHGGRLVIPVGEPYGYQNLMLLEKDAQGVVSTRTILGVAFVPLVEAGHDKT
ncbi:MAG: protein-L-isoaspartate(D-aspartate) O-methyltransferase [Gammaproteobacteria bacterium]|jgi:protein-L-isoaspartate(D-aspartate) O-methyltransferase